MVSHDALLKDELTFDTNEIDSGAYSKDIGDGLELNPNHYYSSMYRGKRKLVLEDEHLNCWVSGARNKKRISILMITAEHWALTYKNSS